MAGRGVDIQLGGSQSHLTKEELSSQKNLILAGKK